MKTGSPLGDDPRRMLKGFAAFSFLNDADHDRRDGDDNDQSEDNKSHGLPEQFRMEGVSAVNEPASYSRRFPEMRGAPESRRA